jgi:hypothetical protein
MDKLIYDPYSGNWAGFSTETILSSSTQDGVVPNITINQNVQIVIRIVKVMNTTNTYMITFISGGSTTWKLGFVSNGLLYTGSGVDYNVLEIVNGTLIANWNGFLPNTNDVVCTNSVLNRILG